MAEGPLLNGLITIGNRLTVFWGLIRLPNLLAVKQHIGCRLNVVGAMEERANFRAKAGLYARKDVWNCRFRTNDGLYARERPKDKAKAL